MENKINLVELLKNCPNGMELDCTMFDNVILLSVDYNEGIIYPIKVLREDGFSLTLTKYGQCTNTNSAKCVIFPKGKTTWEGFVPLYKFKNGDVIIKNNYIAIISHIESNGRIWYHCWYNTKYKNCKIKTDFGIGCINDNDKIRFATEEEKEKLFNVIKDNGCKWNPETKTLEKLIVPKKFDITTLKPFDKVLTRSSLLEEWRIQIFDKYDKTNKYPFMCLGRCRYRQCIPYNGNEHLYDKIDECDEFYKIW